MATRYAVASGLWSATSTWSATDGGAAGASVPADGDTVYISAAVNVQMDVDHSAWTTGISTLTIRGGVTPGMLYWKDGASGYLLMKTATNLVGTTSTNRGRLLANSDGAWGNTTPLAFTTKAVIAFPVGSNQINAQDLDVRLYCTEPVRKFVRTYATKYDRNAASDVDPATDLIDFGAVPPTSNTAVQLVAAAGATLPTPLIEDFIYYIRAISGNTAKLSTTSSDAGIIDITADGSGTFHILTGHSSTSTGVMNVFDDVTGDAAWTTATGHNRCVLVDMAPAAVDMQRGITMSGITATTITLSANVDSAQYPCARIYNVARNVSLRSLSQTTTIGVITFGSKSANAGDVLNCEVARMDTSAVYGSGVIATANYGVGVTVGGTVHGATTGINLLTSPTINGVVTGCTTSVATIVGGTLNGDISGGTTGLSGCYNMVVSSGATVYGCTSGFTSGQALTLAGRVGYCSTGIGTMSNITVTSAGSVRSCSTGIASCANVKVYGEVVGFTTSAFGVVGETVVIGGIGTLASGAPHINITDLNAYTNLTVRNTRAQPALTYAIRNVVNYRANVNFQDYNGVAGAHYRMAQFADIYKNTSVVRTGGQASSIEFQPLSCMAIATNSVERYPYISDWVEDDVPASAQTRTVYVKGENWSGNFPSASELYLEVEYYDGTGFTTVTAVSTGVLSDNTTWTPLTVSFTPGRVSNARYRLWFGKYAATCKVYVDAALYQGNGLSFPFSWRDGEAHLSVGETSMINELYAAVQALAEQVGIAGAGLTALGDERIANLDATVSSRLAPAGTLATVTNLTNAPTAGDLTAAMKASVTTAATAATPTAAAVTGSVGSVVAPVTAGTVTDKTGYALAVAPLDAAQTQAAAQAAITASALAIESAPGVLEAAIGAIDEVVITPSDLAAISAIVETAAQEVIAPAASELSTLVADVNAALDQGVAYVTPADAQPVSTKLVSTLFNEIRMVLRDQRSNQYKNELMVPLYNRAIDEIGFVLMGLSAEVAMGHATFVGDGTNQDFALPSDFRAFVPAQLLPRSPIDATSGYTHGRALEHVDQHHPRIIEGASAVSDPTVFCLVTDATNQYLRFNCVPRSGNRYDALYYRVTQTVTEGTIGAVTTPWLGLLDPLIARTMEQYCREGLEFNQETRAVWRARAEADAAMLLGLRHLQTQTIHPSLWKGVPR